jgi:uncharacterized protein (DUF433 family)
MLRWAVNQGSTAKIDVRTQPAYSLTEAAHYLRLSPGTLRSWVVGRPHLTTSGPRTFASLIRAAKPQPTTLSFWNLVEAHVLRALRTEHGIPVAAVCTALRYAERELGIENLLLRQDLLTDAGRILLDRYGELIDLSNSGQLAMRKVLEAHLRRVDWDVASLPARFFPFLTADGTAQDRLIAIDPRVAFGRPVLQRAGVSTQVIVDRLDAGEAVEDLAADDGITAADVEQAVLYEGAA